MPVIYREPIREWKFLFLPHGCVLMPVPINPNIPLRMRNLSRFFWLIDYFYRELILHFPREKLPPARCLTTTRYYKTIGRLTDVCRWLFRDNRSRECSI